MSESDARVQGSGQSLISGVVPPQIPPQVIQQTPQQTVIDPKAKAFTDKLLELVGEVYTLAVEISAIDDPNLLNHPVVKQARKVVAKVKELKDALGTK